MKLACLLTVLVACSSSSDSSSRKPVTTVPEQSKPDKAAAEMPPNPPLPPTVPADPRYFAPSGTPDPLSCRDDKDCIADTIVDTQKGCCIQETDPMPQTWAWHAWVAEHRMTSDCHEVKCKPVAVPAKLPKTCLVDARCTVGRCSNGCDAPPADAGVGAAVLRTGAGARRSDAGMSAPRSDAGVGVPK